MKDHMSNSDFEEFLIGGEESIDDKIITNFSFYEDEIVISIPIKRIRNCIFKEGIRFNQGDAYFAENLNFDTPVSQVEKATTPIISELF